MGQQSEKALAAVNAQTKFKLIEQQLKQSQKSQIPPYYQHEIQYLQFVFSSLDSKNIKTIQISQLGQIYFLKEHPLFQRVVMLFQQETKKLKVKRITFQILLHLLSVFHILSDIQAKYKFLFRLYDWDKDFKLNSDDLVRSFQIMFKGPLYTHQSYQYMAIQCIGRYGTKGEIKFQNFREYISEGQVKQAMTFKFNGLN